jgi:hypothetical protein
MKKMTCFLLAIISLFLTSCSWIFYDNFQKFDDEFKNSKKIIARIILDPEERRTEINSAAVIFEREVSSNQDIVKAYFVIARSTVSTYAKTDSTGVKTGQTTDIDENIWIDDKFMFTLTPEIISKIKKADEFIVRFYFGPIPATFKFKGSKLKPIHKVLDEYDFSLREN